MQLDRISRILFVIYCVEAGAVFLLLPWGAAWDRTMVQLPHEEIRNLLLHPFTRSLISGFGILHFTWALHDLDALLSRRRSGSTATR